jgi:CRP-like cAMP-binding protein
MRSLPLGETVNLGQRRGRQILFPVSSIISLLHVMKDGASAETAIVGREGGVGISSLMGGDAANCRGVVQSAGVAVGIPRNEARREFDRGGAFQTLLLRYFQALMIQMSQTAACNRHHAIDQQLSRWLLMSVDRLDADELQMTQELIANMLGVRREGVTDAAGKLQRLGLITYSRGRIKIEDRAGLEAHTCECYETVNREFNRLLY